MFVVDEVIDITKGELFADKVTQRKIKGFSIDSRTIKKGQAFIAVKGDKFDGHDFISDVIDQGVDVVILNASKRKLIKNYKTTIFILVEDTIKALGYIARAHRMKFDIPVIAITGSAGKTTVKDMLAKVLSSRYRVLKNERSFNNCFGVPLTLLKLKKIHKVVVLELGINMPLEMQWLSYIAYPDIAIFTNIGPSHLEGLGTPRKVLSEKWSLTKNMFKPGTIILNGDDVLLKGKVKKIGNKLKCFTFGLGKENDFKASRIEQNNKGFSFFVNNHSYSLKLFGQYQVFNALAVICCAKFLSVSIKDIQKTLKNTKASQQRNNIIKKKGNWIIDDSYNANPLSFENSLQLLSLINIKGKKVCICGDMLELGEKSIFYHEHIGKKAANLSIDYVFSVGKHSLYISKTFADLKGKTFACHCKSIKDLKERLKPFCIDAKNNAFLVKGSRGMKMEDVVAFLNEFVK